MLQQYIGMRKIVVLVCFVVNMIFISPPLLAKSHYSPTLMDYIHLNDGVFDVDLITTIPNSGFTVYVYKLTSQKWRSANEVNRILWEHRLTLVVPNNVSSNKAILFTFGGENSADYLTPDASRIQILATFALATGSISAQVSQVPNQPLIFLDEPNTGRLEDDLVAYSWDTAMGTRDYTWAAYLPMTKSVIRAMDAIQLSISDIDENSVPDDFVIAGFSKRGAIAWLAAAVDERVVAISPGVFDSLNFKSSFEHQRKTYGEFALPLIDYDKRNVLDRIRTLEGHELRRVVDPYSYRHLIDIPKYIINASGDQFYPPDSSRFYLSKLKGETLIRYIPNTDHGGANGGFQSALLGMLSWYQRIVANANRPIIQWNITGDGILSANVDNSQASAVLWSVVNPTARDFRLETIGASWQSQPVTIDNNGNVEVELDLPAVGWAAYYIEVTSPGLAGIPDVYSTPVFILPDVTSFSLEQPVSEPLSEHEWGIKLADIMSGNEPNEALMDSFPMRAVGNVSISDISDAHHLLLQNYTSSKIKAQQACLTTRLNIKDNRIDWYSKKDSNKFLYKLWNFSNAFYHHHFYWGSAIICEYLNA